MATGRYDRPVRGSDKLDDLSQGLPLSGRDKGRALGYGRSPRGGAKKPAMPVQVASAQRMDSGPPRWPAGPSATIERRGGALRALPRPMTVLPRARDQLRYGLTRATMWLHYNYG